MMGLEYSRKPVFRPFCRTGKRKRLQQKQQKNFIYQSLYPSSKKNAERQPEKFFHNQAFLVEIDICAHLCAILRVYRENSSA